LFPVCYYFYCSVKEAFIEKGEKRMFCPKANKCRLYIALFLILLIVCLAGNLYYEFKYIDFAYLIAVVVVFIRFLNVKENG
jgi:hypothetical protein